MAVLPEIRLTTTWVASAMAGVSAGNAEERVFDGVSIDTRSLKSGELFVAIRGERLDGSQFVPEAIAAGAAGVVVPKGHGVPGAHVSVIEVDDTTLALQALAHAVRRASSTKVVAITGSAGKTTTKEVTGEFLSATYHVVRTQGNFNNHIGLPLSLIELRKRPEIAVVELGMNHVGEISTLVRVAEPEVRVWTNVGEAHLGFFPSVDAIADAKAEILEGADATTVLVANADDDLVMPRTAGFVGKVVTFGIERPADVRASGVVSRGIDGMTAAVNTRRGAFELSTPLVGRANLANILAATAVAVEFDVPLADIAARAEGLQPAPRRGEVLRLGRQVTVIDDSYNANPTATIKALDLLGGPRRATRRVAILGEMLELGDHAVALHEAVGRAAAQLHVDLLVTVGGVPAEAMAAAAVAAGLRRDQVHYFSSSAAAAAPQLVAPGDLVLVKGSRGVRTDRIVDRLKAEFA